MVSFQEIKLAELRVALLQIAATRTPTNEPLTTVMANAHFLFHFVGLSCPNIEFEEPMLNRVKPAGNA